MSDFKNDQLVRLKEPENKTEQAFIFKVIDDRDQDRLLCQCINSTLKLPPVEEFHYTLIELV